MKYCLIYTSLVSFTLHLIIDVSKMLEAPSIVDLTNQYEFMTEKSVRMLKTFEIQTNLWSLALNVHLNSYI